MAAFSDERIARILKSRGLKVTPQRLAVAQAFTKLNHPTAEEIFRFLEKEHPYIGLATIYRTLKLFIKTGLVKELSFPNIGTRYDINLEPHINVVCVKCGAIEDVENEEINKIMRRFANDGYEIVGCRFEVSIYCDDCKARRLKRSRRR